MLLYIIVGILLFGLLIAVHEGGHFLSAKLLGVRVNEFAIGMGPALFSRKRGETQYSLRLFPVGGYCAMEGEDGESDDPGAFSSKAPWRRFIILAAGSVCNLIAGFVLVALLFVSVGGYTTPVISGFMEGFPCEGEQGLLPGDRILAINGHRVFVSTEISTFLAEAKGAPVDVTIRRNGETLVQKSLPLSLQTYTLQGQQVQRFGLYLTQEEVTLPGLLRQSWNTSCYFGRAVWTGLAMLVRGEVGLRDMSGPVGIVSYLGQAGSEGESIATGLQNVVYVMALIAVNLGIMNLLPLPALDGGRIFLLLLHELWFLLTRREIDPKYEAYVHTGGFFALILLMAVITFSDVWKLVS